MSKNYAEEHLERIQFFYRCCLLPGLFELVVKILVELYAQFDVVVVFVSIQDHNYQKWGKEVELSTLGRNNYLPFYCNFQCHCYHTSMTEARHFLVH